MSNLIRDAMRQLDELLLDAYRAASGAGALPPDAEPSGVLEIPRDPSNGDFAATHAMAAARAMRRPPREIAGALLAHIKLDGGYFATCGAAGAGFMNFTLSDKWYSDVLRAAEEDGASYGRSDYGGGKRVMVEFVSANPTGPMTIGNARGGVLGDALASVLEMAGYDVRREFYVNDAGNQVELFGKSAAARYMQICLGEDAVRFPENGYHGDDIRELAAEVYGREGDSLAALPESELARRFVEIGIPRNIELMREHLERYRIRFDEWFPESRLHASGYVEDTIRRLTESGLTYESDGALWLKNTALGADKDEVLRRSDGSYTYQAADIAYHRDKFAERGFERVIDVLGADHHGHTVRFGAMMSAPALRSALGVTQGELEFLLMQMVLLKRDGEVVKVSKRTGKALTLNDLLDEISVDACRFFFNAKPDTHLEFDLDLAVRQDSENPVYYVQYAHARICSLIDALGADGHCVPAARDIDAALLREPSERELIKQIALLPEEIVQAARDRDPSRINRYVTELAARFHKFYGACRMRGEREDVLKARLKLADTTRRVVAIGLGVIGVTAPERM
ncbi:MAG: arginine--tRNA ligase [Oscillospiraceae bacterium]|jgi:arginyl-tRNA synthetase|nr:arginine--tRNA ligase [Oscillospiraceae bacterium]